MYDNIQRLPPPYEPVNNVMQNVGEQFNLHSHDVSPTTTRFEAQPMCASTMTFDEGRIRDGHANTPSCNSTFPANQYNSVHISRYMKRKRVSQMRSFKRPYQPRTESISPHMGAPPARFHRQAYEPRTETITPDAVHQQQMTTVQQTYGHSSPANYNSNNTNASLTMTQNGIAQQSNRRTWSNYNFHNNNTSPTRTHIGTAQHSIMWTNYNSHNNNSSPTIAQNGTAQQASRPTWSNYNLHNNNTSPTRTHSGIAHHSLTWPNYNSHNNNTSPTIAQNGTEQQSITWSNSNLHNNNASPTRTHNSTSQHITTWTNYNSHNSNTLPTIAHNGTAQNSSTSSNYKSHNNTLPKRTRNRTAQQSSTCSNTLQMYIPTNEVLTLELLMTNSLCIPPYLTETASVGSNQIYQGIPDCSRLANQSPSHAQANMPYTYMGDSDCANQRIKETFNLPYCTNGGQAIGYAAPQSTNHERNTDYYVNYIENSVERETNALNLSFPVSPQVRTGSTELGFGQNVQTESLEYGSMRSSNLHSPPAVEQTRTMRCQSLDHILIMNARIQMGLL